MRNQRDCYERQQKSPDSSQRDQIQPVDPEEMKRFLELWEARSSSAEPSGNSSRSIRHWLKDRLVQLWRFVRKVFKKQ